MSAINAMSHAELVAALERAKAENAKLKSKKAQGKSIKKSAKGAVSVYGLGRWPVTLYAAQWAELIKITGDIQAFIETNKAELSFKPGQEEAQPESSPEQGSPTAEVSQASGQ